MSKKATKQLRNEIRDAKQDRDYWSKVQASDTDPHGEASAGRAVNRAQAKIDAAEAKLDKMS